MFLLQSVVKQCRQLLQILLWKLRPWIGEGQVRDGLHGNEVDVGMRDFESGDHDTDPEARDFLSKDAGYALGKNMEMGQVVIFHIKYVIDFYLGDDQGMPKDDRTYIEECQAAIVFSNLVARDFSGDDP